MTGIIWFFVFVVGALALAYQRVSLLTATLAYGGALLWEGRITNVNTLALEEMSDAAAHAILTFAMSTSSVSGTAKASPTAMEHGERMGAHFRR